VGRDPLQVKVDYGPQNVLNPSAVFLSRLDQPFRVLEQDINAERWAICRSTALRNRKEGTLKKTLKSHTCGGGTDASLGIKKFVEFDIEHSLSDATGEYVPSEADHLLGSRESVDHIVHLGSQARIIEYSELVEPGMVDEAGVAQPVNRELGMVRIWDDGSNHANLGVEQQE
jgi:hypothetical protein